MGIFGLCWLQEQSRVRVLVTKTLEGGDACQIRAKFLPRYLHVDRERGGEATEALLLLIDTLFGT